MAEIRWLKGKDKRVFRREAGVQLRTIVPPTREEQPPVEPDDPEALTGMDWYFDSEED